MRLRKILLVCALSIFCFTCMSPSDETIDKEFLAERPNAEILSKELIFEQDYVEVYLIKYREKHGEEILTTDFAMSQKNGVWSRCDDRANVKCK